MNDHPARVFEDTPGMRDGGEPLLLGLIGPQQSGKTFSALRLATGMQKVIGGDIFVIDTEHKRAKLYSDYFKFRHVNFAPPFTPDDYIEAIRHCEKRGAKIVIIDSMTHEHSGQGGVLEWHAAEVERLMASWRCSEEKANIPAWGKPKAARRRLINVLTQSGMNFLLCFRAKDKIKIGSGKVVELGWMPDCGEEFAFELIAKCLLLPGAGGIPTLQSDQIGEKLMIKIPEQFREMFTGAAGKPLSEEFGQRLAEWAAGTKVETFDVELLFSAYADCATPDRFTVLEQTRNAAWSKLKGPDKQRLKTASDAAKDRIAAQQQATEQPAETPADEPT
jgi:hypothetical protein